MECHQEHAARQVPGARWILQQFFVACWGIIKVDIMDAFNSLSRRDARGFSSVNQALITLLPKKAGAEEVRDFRPISLIHGFAKLVAKVVSCRVAPSISNLVGAHQSAFIRG